MIDRSNFINSLNLVKSVIFINVADQPLRHITHLCVLTQCRNLVQGRQYLRLGLVDSLVLDIVREDVDSTMPHILIGLFLANLAHMGQ